jgi:plastocyanin
MSSRLLISMLGLSGVCASLWGADIRGTVVIHRTLTKRKVTVSATSYDRGALTPVESQSSEDPLVFERRHVAIYLEDTAAAGVGANSLPTPVMEQRNRQFVPDLAVIPAGSAVSFPNIDPIFHNIFSLSKSRSFDLGNYPKGQMRLVTFPKPGIVVIGCHLHSNMAAFIVVTPGPWGTLADANGNFVLRNAPPGDHKIVAWHKIAGTFRKSIHVEEGRTENVEFLIPLDEAGSPLVGGKSSVITRREGAIGPGTRQK